MSFVVFASIVEVEEISRFGASDNFPVSDKANTAFWCHRRIPNPTSTTKRHASDTIAMQQKEKVGSIDHVVGFQKVGHCDFRSKVIIGFFERHRLSMALCNDWLEENVLQNI